MNPSRLRVIDTGVGEARYNLALGQALVDVHRAGDVPNTLRFVRFPPSAIIGRHQALSREVNLDHCHAHGIGLARRITGGGAIYLDEGQLGWELAIDRAHLGTVNLGEVTAKICTAAAEGLSRLGIDVAYRPRNDLEVGGRKIGGTGGFFDGDTLFFQGTVLIDMNPVDMIAALNIPAAKLAKRDLESAGQRVVTLKDLLGARRPSLADVQEAFAAGIAEGLGLAREEGDFTEAETALARQYYEDEIGTDDFVFEIDDPSAGPNSDRGVHHGAYTGGGGTITAHVRLDGPGQGRIREVVISGDFFVTPPRVILDLEAKLRGVAVEAAAGTVEDFFEDARIDLLTAKPADFAAALDAALGFPLGAHSAKATA